MAEYIEREAVLKKLKQEGCDCEFVRSLLDCPAVDVAPVVRCKDCKHWEDGWLGYCTKSHTAMPYDGFCSNGERKDGEG